MKLFDHLILRAFFKSESVISEHLEVAYLSNFLTSAPTMVGLRWVGVDSHACLTFCSRRASQDHDVETNED